MARYGQAFRDRIVARLLPPDSAAIEVVSREVGVSVGTLDRWRAAALGQADHEVAAAVVNRGELVEPRPDLADVHLDAVTRHWPAITTWAGSGHFPGFLNGLCDFGSVT